MLLIKDKSTRRTTTKRRTKTCKWKDTRSKKWKRKTTRKEGKKALDEILIEIAKDLVKKE